MLLVARVVVYEVALAILLVLLPLQVALGPGTEVGILAEWLQAPGLLLALVGFALWLWATVELVARGWGTPLPLDPPQHLVTSGPYAWIRNPMHVGLVALLVGIALLFRSPAFFLYTVGIVAVVLAYVRWVEDPSLERRFGEQYLSYRDRVSGWVPRRPARRRRPIGPTL